MYQAQPRNRRARDLDEFRPVARLTILVDAPMKTPIPKTAPSSTITPSATSDRAPTNTLSSMITGSACNGSKKTPPIPAPPEM